MSCMLRTKDCVPAGTLAQVIAGDVPSPGAAPSAAWLNLTGISPPSGNPVIVIVIGGPPAPGAPARCPARCCATSGTAMSETAIDTKNHRPVRMFVLLNVDL